MRRNRHAASALRSAAPASIGVHESSQKCGNTPSVRLLTIANTALRKYQTEMYHATRRLPPSPAGASSKDAVGAFKDAALAVVTRAWRRTMPNDASPKRRWGGRFAFRERRSRWPRRGGSRPQRRSRASSDSRRAPGPRPARASAAPSPTAAIARDALAEKWLFQVNNAREIFFSVDETFVTATPDAGSSPLITETPHDFAP